MHTDGSPLTASTGIYDYAVSNCTVQRLCVSREMGEQRNRCIENGTTAPRMLILLFVNGDFTWVCLLYACVSACACVYVTVCVVGSIHCQVLTGKRGHISIFSHLAP